MDLKLRKLMCIFHQTFTSTQLIPSGVEPLYLPRSVNGLFAQIIFKDENLSSALHEISHWCIAGSKRRLLEDFGYWYEPDGRCLQQQKLFERVEVKPQALEWILADSIDHKFNLSLDNLNGAPLKNSDFEKKVILQKKNYLKANIPQDAAKLLDSIKQDFISLQT